MLEAYYNVDILGKLILDRVETTVYASDPAEILSAKVAIIALFML